MRIETRPVANAAVHGSLVDEATCPGSFDAADSCVFCASRSDLGGRPVAVFAALRHGVPLPPRLRSVRLTSDRRSQYVCPHDERTARPLPAGWVDRVALAVPCFRAWGSALPSRLLLAWGPAVGLMAAIYVGSDWSGTPQLLRRVSDLPVHAGTYAALAAAMLHGLTGARRDRGTTRTALLAGVLATAYGITDEFHQSFVPGRYADLRDVAANALGATGGAALGWAWCQRSGRSGPASPPLGS